MGQNNVMGKWLRALAVLFFIGLATFGVRDHAYAINVSVSEVEAADTTPVYYLTRGTSDTLTFEIPVEEEYVTGEDGTVYNQFVYPEVTKITSSKPSVAGYDDGTVTGLADGTATVKISYRYSFQSGTVKKSASVKIRVVPYKKDGTTLTIVRSLVEDGDIYYCLNTAAKEARDFATAENPYVIRVPAGNYTLSNTVVLYSNVTVSMNAKTVITMTGPTGKNMFYLGSGSVTYQGQENYNHSEACAGYGGFENVTIKGGTLVGNSESTSLLIRMAHATNLTFDSVTFSGGSGKHQVEVAAINGFTVKNCVFKDFHGTSGNSRLTCEALQIDIPTSETNYPGAYQDGTPMKNVEITGCTFKNLAKGIGAHTVLVGAYHTNIKINNNTFTNITYGAIVCLNYYKCEIKDNVIKNCGAGIDFAYYIPSYLSTSNCMFTTTFEGTTAYKKNIRHNAKTVISGNKITVRHHTDSISCVGINIYGYNRTTTATGVDGKTVKAQNYYISGVTVTDNKIVTAGYGIRLSDAKSCTITDNTITGKNFSADDAHIKNGNTYDGIYLTYKSSTLKLSGNTISKMNGGGIYLSNSTALGGIKDNTISGVKRYGIYLYSGSTAKVGITGNTIKSTSKAEALIYLNTTSTTRHIISGNTLEGYKKKNAAIKVDKGKFSISKNTISRVSYGVVLSDDAKGYIYGNTCTSKSASRIRFTDKNYYMADALKGSRKKYKTYKGVRIYKNK
jgi:parallel beta-helix repeat protein